MFNIVSKKNDNAFKAMLVSKELIRCTSFTVPTAIFHYIERFHSAEKRFLTALNTSKPSFHFL